VSPREIAFLAALERRRLKPHTLATARGATDVEVISYPWAAGDDVRVMVRTIPGDPTTLTEVSAFDVLPTGRPCSCASLGEFYHPRSRAAYYRGPRLVS